MLTKSENWIEELKENLSKEWESIKNNKADLNNIITERKSKLEGINSRLPNREEGISGLEDRQMEINKKEWQGGKKNLKNEDNLRNF